MAHVPVLRLAHLTPEQVRAYVIADNRLAEKAGWNEGLLALELGELAELDFDVTLTGFDTAEIDKLLNPMLADEDEVPEPDAHGVPVTVLGDLWLLGPHRILCGDATQLASYTHLLGSDQAQMVFTDPPYNVPIEGHVNEPRRMVLSATSEKKRST